MVHGSLLTIINCYPKNNERRTNNNEQRTKNKEQRTTNKEQRTNNKEQRTNNDIIVIWLWIQDQQDQVD